MRTLAMVCLLSIKHIEALLTHDCATDFPWSLQHWFPLWSGADHHDVRFRSALSVLVFRSDGIFVSTVPPHELPGLLLDLFPMVGPPPRHRQVLPSLQQAQGRSAQEW